MSQIGIRGGAVHVSVKEGIRILNTAFDLCAFRKLLWAFCARFGRLLSASAEFCLEQRAAASAHAAKHHEIASDRVEDLIANMRRHYLAMRCWEHECAMYLNEPERRVV